MKIGDGELYRDKLIASPINANTTNVVETVTFPGFSAVHTKHIFYYRLPIIHSFPKWFWHSRVK